MEIRTKIEIGVAVLLAAILLVCAGQHRKIQQLIAERGRLKNNVESLMEDVEKYRVFDSLSAARVVALELSIKEFERYRASDAALIKELQLRNRDLSAINKTQSETIIELSAVPRDTVIIRDSIPIPAVSVTCGDAWFDFYGILTPDEFTGTLHNRDSLLLAESVKYRRFLGFLWKTKRILNRELDVVSKNPHTEIMSVEHVVIEK